MHVCPPPMQVQGRVLVVVQEAKPTESLEILQSIAVKDAKTPFIYLFTHSLVHSFIN